MPLDNLISKEPKQFEYFHRLMGYIMLSLVIVVYHYTQPDTQYQIYIPAFLFFLILVVPKFSHWLIYRYSNQVKRNVLFLIDIIVIAVLMSAVHLSLVLTFLAVFALLYTTIYNKINFLMMSLAGIVGVTVFYLCNIYVFGFQEYFESTSSELTVLGFLCLITYFSVGTFYQHTQVQSLSNKKNHYYDQMNRYMEFANQLSRYAPMQLWQSIMKGESEAKIEYKRKKLTIFFSDIQGFTELSETLIPDDLAFLLNDYLSHMTEIAKQYEATVDKFMGDAILIFFGDPHSQGVEQDAKTCLEMAMVMRQQMKLLRERWIKMGYPPLHIRMGISTGYCHVGNYGAAHRMAYTIVGRDANLAARLQSAAEVDEILISDDTHHLVKNDYLCAPKAPIFLKGIKGPVRTWQVMEKYTSQKTDYQRWFDYEYKGFNLLLNLDEVQNFEYPELIHVLERMIQRLQTQQKMTNSAGIVKLNLEDEVIEEVKKTESHS
ncbi:MULTISPECIES: adenylate/guanylate cyclase domain-containing protein [Acinetobacter]|uniref:adenylate/guanylate cyclase domain-containing protein n=2 Tax=Moraxellaceae TaxID=468 RepID=UPI00099213D6|nr:MULTISPECIES: adenylate/guanylate cyclase domain-containing protein [unclassified Acinetobacter]MCL6240061.1 adenylate/guanylate cyclase domain-containing protein [Acinetobacter amyesii]MCL6243467.1 adenylate/guanylate cyclase domain-containing protein [Acinetobacter amyesii]OOV81492.1 adenylate/guanylate cyclase domain-containing protein [Acinetobacter sp. ANC 5600]QOW49879.1 adenylate/guanylate cyclase domain-containing protein [Acinetobacter sp. YH12138]UIJ74470.1 adenylate/guanylate cyc